MKRKFYTLINVAGLAIGMTCCILISIYLYHEWSHDQYHAKCDRIYRVVQTFRSVEQGTTPGTPSPHGKPRKVVAE
jgi:putative ABC transport system permease protein